uniref:Si:dkey-85n7.8 n=1 Tax=Kryptolebias marmoratus TaxID=37003 RepID=A0A3Q2ZG16_KRYMA
MSSVLRMMGNASIVVREVVILQSDLLLTFLFQQSFFVMSVFAVTMLTPAAWILHHLPEYRERTQQSPRT